MDEFIEGDLLAFGAVLTPEAQAYFDAQRQSAVAPFEVLSWCWRAVRAILANKTQWRVHGLGGLIGLDDTPIRDYLKDEGYSRKRRRRVMEQIRQIESGVLEELAAQAEANKAGRPNG